MIEAWARAFQTHAIQYENEYFKKLKINKNSSFITKERNKLWSQKVI